MRQPPRRFACQHVSSTSTSTSCHAGSRHLLIRVCRVPPAILQAVRVAARQARRPQAHRPALHLPLPRLDWPGEGRCLPHCVASVHLHLARRKHLMARTPAESATPRPALPSFCPSVLERPPFGLPLLPPHNSLGRRMLQLRRTCFMPLWPGTKLILVVCLPHAHPTTNPPSLSHKPNVAPSPVGHGPLCARCQLTFLPCFCLPFSAGPHHNGGCSLLAGFFHGSSCLSQAPQPHMPFMPFSAAGARVPVLAQRPHTS